MDISINLVTLEYLMNPELYKRYVKDKGIDNNDLTLSKELYKDKIINVTQDMINKTVTIPHLNKAFNNYVKECIEYFKFIDRVDFYQSQYTDSSSNDTLSSITDISDSELYNHNDISLNSVIMKHESNVDITKFVKIVNKQPEYRYPEIKHSHSIDNHRVNNKLT